MRRSHSYKSDNSFVVYGSLSENVDLMNGILEECKIHGITSGSVTCIGSLKKVGYVLFRTSNGYPSGYSQEIIINKPVELINCTGFICQDEHNNMDIHLHGLVSEENGSTSAGHFLPQKNPTLITVEFMITCDKNIEAKRIYDKDLGFKVINFSK